MTHVRDAPCKDNISEKVRVNRRIRDDHFHQILLHQYATSILIGIDLSLKCPGLCIVDVSQRSIRLVYCQLRQYEHDFTTVIRKSTSRFYEWQVYFVVKLQGTASDMSSHSAKHRMIRFSSVCDFLDQEISVVMKRASTMSPPLSVHFAIESYSYASQQTASTSILYELGGIVRFHIYTRWKVLFDELSPCHIKKVFTCNGHAGKTSMIAKFFELTGIDEQHVYTELGMLKFDRSVRKDLHPLEDLVDAFAICYTYVMDKFPPPKPKRSRTKKRKLNSITKTPHTSPSLPSHPLPPSLPSSPPPPPPPTPLKQEP